MANKKSAVEKKNTNALAQLQSELVRSFGQKAAVVGGLSKQLNVIPTGSLTLDYELGTGGWPLGYLVGVYGPRDIGKSSIVGLNAIRNAQAMNLVCAIVALEPVTARDEQGKLTSWGLWATKLGVDVDNVLITYPTTGEEAFAHLHKILRSGYCDLVIFDSIGALVSESEAAEDGKPRQGGQAGLITWGIKTAAPIAFHNNVCVILLNQVRDNMASRIPGVLQQPGGYALEHHESIIVQLKRGKDVYKEKVNGSEVEIGRTIVAQIVRNKMSEGSGKRALFDFYSMELEGYPFGIDTVSDVLAVAKRTEVIKAHGTWLDLPNGKSVNGVKAAADYLNANPAVVTIVREQVMHRMLEREADVRAGRGNPADEEKPLAVLGPAREAAKVAVPSG